MQPTMKLGKGKGLYNGVLNQRLLQGLRLLDLEVKPLRG